MTFVSAFAATRYEGQNRNISEPERGCGAHQRRRVEVPARGQQQNLRPDDCNSNSAVSYLHRCSWVFSKSARRHCGMAIANFEN